MFKTFKKIFNALVIGSLISLPLAGCDNDDDAAPAPAPASLTEVRVAPIQVNVLEGAAQKFTATAYFSDSTATDVTSTATWSTSDAAVATVDGNGAATGVANGDADITATYSQNGVEKAGKANLHVESASVTITALTLSPVNDSALVGDTLSYTVMAQLDNGHEVDLTQHATYASSDMAVATIDNTGMAQTLDEGTTVITATYDHNGAVSVSNDANLTVIAKALTISEVIVSAKNSKLSVGMEQQYSAKAVMSDGEVIEITSYEGTYWTAIDKGVASSTSKGLVTAQATGATLVTADISYQGVNTIGAKALVVVDASVTDLVITPVTKTLIAGGKQAYTAVANLDNGNTIDVTDVAVFHSSATAVAAFNENVITAIDEGTTTITASYNHNGVVTVSNDADLMVLAKTLTVSQVIVSSVKNENLIVGQTQQYTAKAVMSDGQVIDITSHEGTYWTTTDKSVAHSSEKGEVAALTAGTTLVTAEIHYEGVATQGAKALVVVDVAITDLIITPTTKTLIAGGKQAYTVIAHMTDATKVDLTEQTGTVYKSTHPEVAAFNGNTITAIDEGTTKISASYYYNGVLSVSNEADLTVLPKTLTVSEIVVDAKSPSLIVGLVQQYTAKAIMSDGQVVDITSHEGTYWTTADKSVALSESKGAVTAKAAGTTVVTASIHYEGVATLGSKVLVVVDASIAELLITPNSTILSVGDTQSYTVAALLTNGNEIDITANVSVWNTSDKSVASADVSGTYTAKQVGVTTVTAEYSDGENTYVSHDASLDVVP